MRSKVLQNILNNIDSQVEKNVREWANSIPKNNSKSYGTLESYMLLDMINKGFKPIAITVMMCEETFIFISEKEAKEACMIYKNDGWWYGLDEFITERDIYVKNIYHDKIEDAPIVYWLHKKYE